MQTDSSNGYQINTAAPLNPRLLFQLNGNGVRYLINDLPFSGIGVGVERDSSNRNFGNLDQSALVPYNSLIGGVPNPPDPATGVYTEGHESFPLHFYHITTMSFPQQEVAL